MLDITLHKQSKPLHCNTLTPTVNLDTNSNLRLVTHDKPSGKLVGWV